MKDFFKRLKEETPSDNSVWKKQMDLAIQKAEEKEVAQINKNIMHSIERREEYKTKTAVFDYWMRWVFIVGLPVFAGIWFYFMWGFLKECLLVEGGRYNADPKILISLIGGVSANVITLLVLIVKYLFPSNKEH